MTRSPFRTLFSLLLFIAIAASAQNNRSAVSVTGNDANPCTTVSPCRSFAVALTHTIAGGEVIAIDSGGYGPFTITQAVSVIGAPGVYAALTASFNGIAVTAGSSDRVVIRGLNIIGGANGINATSFGTLSIENCTVTGGSNVLILIAGGAASQTIIADTTGRAATGGGFDVGDGFQISSPAGLVRCRAEKNAGAGLFVASGAAADGVVSAVDFVAVGNFLGAIVSSSAAGHTTFLSLDHALICNNANNGVESNGVASSSNTARVTNSTVTDNGSFGFAQFGFSTFGSMNNNMVEGNAAGATAGTIATISAH